MIRTALYARISDDRRGEGLGVARQREDCRGLAKDRGWTVTAEFIDNDLSAYSGKSRPAFSEMLSAIEAGEFDAVVVYHQDRLTRRPAEFEDFIDKCQRFGVKQFATVSGETDIGQGDGILIARIMAAVAANQSDAAARRIRRKNDENAAAGKPHKTGQRAYGYELDRMTVVESEAKVIREAARRFLAGESLGSVAAWLQADGIRTATGMNEWRTPTLRNLLKSPRIAGLREHRGEVVGEAAWPAIITRQQHEQITSRFAESAARNQRSPRRYLLSGKVFCGACGTKMASSPDGGRRRYGCRKGPDFGGCAKVFINAEPLEEFIVRAVLTRLSSPATAKAIRDAKQPDSVGATLSDELTVLYRKQEELLEMWTDGTLTKRELVPARTRIATRIDSTRRRLARLDTGTGLSQFIGDAESVAAAWDAPDMTLQRQAAVVGAIMSRVVIHPAKKPSNRVDLSRIDPEWIV
jgi:site-specific DNA recombinase